MEDMKNYAYTLFRTIPLGIKKCPNFASVILNTIFLP